MAASDFDRRGKPSRSPLSSIDSAYSGATLADRRRRNRSNETEMRNPNPLVPAALLLPALLLHGCGDQPPDQQAADPPGEPIDLPATPEQLDMLERVVERFPEVKPLADQAKADGTVTEQEIVAVFAEAEQLKEARGGE
jgi:hypothetical protein